MHLACCSCHCCALMVLAAMLVGSEDTRIPLLWLCFRLAHGQRMCDYSWKLYLILSGDFLTCVFLGSFLEVGIFQHSCPGGRGLALPSLRQMCGFLRYGASTVLLCHCPQVWHFSQSLKAISNLGAAGYESTQVGFSQSSSPSLVPFVSFIYLKNKTADS